VWRVTVMTRVRHRMRATQSIPHRVDAAAVGDVSVPLAFICLLHLCNEKDLEVWLSWVYVCR
jgi:hypothetical protein